MRGRSGGERRISSIDDIKTPASETIGRITGNQLSSFANKTIWIEKNYPTQFITTDESGELSIYAQRFIKQYFGK